VRSLRVLVSLALRKVAALILVASTRAREYFDRAPFFFSPQ